MAKFVTYIADPDLESNVIKAIGNIDGELAIRGVSLEQVKSAELDKEITLISGRAINYAHKSVIVDKSMSIDEIAKKLQPESSTKEFLFSKGQAKLICVVGLSGGVGTTTVAINLAFELSVSSSVILSDLNSKNPEIACALGLHRIEDRGEKISKQLEVIQGVPNSNSCEYLVVDLGEDLAHPLLEDADEIYVVMRTGFNSLSRLRQMTLKPSVVIFNFAERSKAQNKWRSQIDEEFPRMRFLNIPYDPKSFELAAEEKGVLMEVAGNSLARKSIATLA